MAQLCIRMPDHLLQRLLAKKEEEGDENVSDTVRNLLVRALENQGSEITTADLKALLHHSVSYSIMVHSFIEESIDTLVEDSESLKGKARERAEKLIADLVENAHQ